MRGVILLFLVLSLPAALWADPGTFPQVAGDVAADLAEATKEKALAEAAIDRERSALQSELTQLRQRLAEEQAALAEEEAALAALRDRRQALTEALQEHTAGMATVTAAVHEFARNFLELAEGSPYAAEAPDRLADLKRLLEKDQAPGISDIRGLVDFAFEDLAASGQRLRRTGTYLDREGRPVTGAICRLGHLSALADGGGAPGYLHTSPASGRLMAAASPGWQVERNLGRYLGGETDAVFLDVTGGAALRQLSRRVTLWEELQSGGFLVWPILLVGLAALVLSIERFFFLGRVRQNTDVLMGRVTALVAGGDFGGALAAAGTQAGRPTANVIKAGLEMQDEPRDIIESRLSEAILKETPRLERFLPALKVLAAIAPLLGLLGTVTGMINTFKVITVHGTGDPRLMAGGISEALITTQLGLAVAIPIMMMAAFLGRKAQVIAGDMEEKAMAMMASLLRRQRNGR